MPCINDCYHNGIQVRKKKEIEYSAFGYSTLVECSLERHQQREWSHETQTLSQGGIIGFSAVKSVKAEKD
ncbi:40463_t:CDS:2, partial [Gigaspora margarita]